MWVRIKTILRDNIAVLKFTCIKSCLLVTYVSHGINKTIHTTVSEDPTSWS